MNSFLGNLQHSELPQALVRATDDDRTNYLDALQDLGVTTIRETFMNWAEIEPLPGQGYRYEAFDDIARKASDRQIEIVALAYPFPKWAIGEPRDNGGRPILDLRSLPARKFEPQFRQFVSTTVRRYCGRYPESIALRLPIRTWIFSNELDHVVSPDEYAFWLRVFYQEVKNADPQARVVHMGLGGLGTTDLTSLMFYTAFLDSVELRGPRYPYFDVASFHCYPGYFGSPNRHFLHDAAGHLKRLFHARGIAAEIWVGETGHRSSDFKEQASEAIKAVVDSASTGARRVYLHGLWDFDAENRWGVLENNPSGEMPRRKPLFTAYQALLASIGRNEGIERIGPGLYLAMLPEGRSCYVVWAEAADPVRAPLTGLVNVRRLDGTERTMDANDLQLSDEPIFVELLSKPVQVLGHQGQPSHTGSVQPRARDNS